MGSLAHGQFPHAVTLTEAEGVELWSVCVYIFYQPLFLRARCNKT